MNALTTPEVTGPCDAPVGFLDEISRAEPGRPTKFGVRGEFLCDLLDAPTV